MKCLKGVKKFTFDYFGVGKLFLLPHFLNMSKYKIVHLYISIKF